MNIVLLGKNLDDVRPVLAKYGLVESDPSAAELVVAHGGDGALLGAQRAYPLLPKLPIRDAATAAPCPEHTAERVIAAFVRGELKLRRAPVLEARCGGEVIRGINDLVIHSLEYVSALRYRVFIDGELYAREVVGDGVCFSGVHGSTAYYRSITHSIFRVGLGLAFSNSTEEVSHLVLSEKSHIEIEIVRGPGVLTADNSPERLPLKTGDVVEMFQVDEAAEVIGLAEFLCPKCRALRHPNKLPFKGYF